MRNPTGPPAASGYRTAGSDGECSSGLQGVTEIGSAWCRHPADIGVQLHIVKRICAATTSSGPPLGSTLMSSTAAAASRPRPPAVSTCRISPKGTLGHAHFVAIWSGRESSISLSPGREESDFPSARRYVCMPYRESGGPEPAPGLNMGQPLWPCSPWIPAFEAVIQLVSTSMVTILICAPSLAVPAKAGIHASTSN